jgi:hypothetical protein
VSGRSVLSENCSKKISYDKRMILSLQVYISSQIIMIALCYGSDILRKCNTFKCQCYIHIINCLYRVTTVRVCTRKHITKVSVHIPYFQLCEQTLPTPHIDSKTTSLSIRTIGHSRYVVLLYFEIQYHYIIVNMKITTRGGNN